MQYSPRVRSPLSAVDNNIAPSYDGVFKKPLAPAPRIQRSDVPIRERSGSTVGLGSLRLTRSASSIEPHHITEQRRARNGLTCASDAIPTTPPQAPYPAAAAPIVPCVTLAAAPSSPSSSSFNMSALNKNLPATSGRPNQPSTTAAAAAPAPDSPDQSMDFEKIPVFPTINNADVPDFPCLSADTLADLLRGALPTHITRVILVDCRFEYEYQGGHVKSAINLHTEELIERTFTRSLIPAENLAIIFYCEFSSYRGPRLCRFLRSWDRKMNFDCYPRLHYENLFVLKGGYKNFFTAHPDLCDPSSYLPMSDPRYSEQCSAGLASCKKPRPTRSYSWSGLSQPLF